MQRCSSHWVHPEVLNLSRKVQVIHDPQMDARYPRWRPARLILHTVQGNTYTAEAEIPHGNPEDPLSDEVINQKFMDCARYAGNRSAQKIQEVFWRIETLEDVSQCMNLLSG